MFPLAVKRAGSEQNLIFILFNRKFIFYVLPFGKYRGVTLRLFAASPLRGIAAQPSRKVLRGSAAASAATK